VLVTRFQLGAGHAAQALRFDSCLQSVALVSGQPPVASADQVVFGKALALTAGQC